MNARKRLRRAWAPLLLLCIGLAFAVYALTVRPAPAPPAATPPLPPGPAPRAPVAWLGLNYNSGSGTGSLRDFAARGIVYDREGGLEARAGATPTNSAKLSSGLAVSYGAGMVPILQVNPVVGQPGCKTDPVPSKLCLPTSQADVTAYVEGFVQTASSVLRAYPGRPVLFEPTNEPWTWAWPPGTMSGRTAAREYAALLAQLLPAARAASIPLTDIYVPATGVLLDGTPWVPDLYDAQPCLKPGAGTCGPVGGWNFHPYGLPFSTLEGISMVPRVRAQMLSGEDNIVISEVGFCADDVNGGKSCNHNKADIVSGSTQTAAWLHQTLTAAARMHREGWLRALLVWERAGTGWAMQNVNGTLTAQGRVLDLFAGSAAGR